MKFSLSLYFFNAVILCSACNKVDDHSQTKDETLNTTAISDTNTIVPSISVVEFEPMPVIKRGTAGSWDAADVLNPSVIEFRGKLLNFYSGYDGSLWQTGLATSTDNGMTWSKQRKPVLGLGKWDTKYIAANGSAISIDKQIFYYFHGMNSAGKHEIGLSTSEDGLSLTMYDKPVLSEGASGNWDDLLVADPYVIKMDSKYLMYFLASDIKYHFSIGVASSTDGRTWIKHGGPIISSGTNGDWDSFAVGEPAVFYSSPFYYMLYTGTNPIHQRNIGWAYSTDGIDWIKKGPLIKNSMRQPWNSQIICDPTVLPTGRNDSTYHVWFGGGDQPQDAQNLNGEIGRFTIKIQNTEKSVSR